MECIVLATKREKNQNFGESLPQQIAKHILRKILKRELQPGSKIVEEDISTELNISRAPVREALYLLQADGIIERMPRKGCIVASFTDREIIEYTEATISLVQSAILYGKLKWTDVKREELKQLYKLLDNVQVQGQVEKYHWEVNNLITFLFDIAENKALLRFYQEAQYILVVFVQIHWSVETMRVFHQYLSLFVESVLQSNWEEANRYIELTLRSGLELR